MDTSFLPWHDALWQNIWQSWQQDRMPHALLLNGAAGMGKRQFALALARFALCSQPVQYSPCGQCKSCHLFMVGSHPDFVEIAPEEAGKAIKIDRIRDLIEFCSLTTQYGRYRVVALAPAEAMNTNAANSLLKLLEEPPPRTLLLLISHQPARLPATIRSRCQRLLFSPQPEAARAWLATRLPPGADAQTLLQQSHYAPLAALALAGQLEQRQAVFASLRELAAGKQEPLRTAADWLEIGALLALPWMMQWTMELLRCRMGAGNEPALQAVAARFDSRALFALLDEQMECWRIVSSSSSIKPQGLLESLALRWHGLGAK